MSSPVLIDRLRDDAVWRVTFGTAPGNILDATVMEALASIFHDAARAPQLKAIVLEGAGPDFSFGASVQEHLPGAVEDMLRRFRELLLSVLDSAVVLLPVVRGRCLGGGLELATLGHRMFAAPDATFGQPEIALGVFAPAASVILPQRIGRPAAEDLCLTGRTIGADEARAIGLVDAIAGDPTAAALAWADAHLLSKSASSLRHAVRAIRADLVARIRQELPAIEAAYLRDLMTTGDAVEGLRAFLEKRPPQWRDK
jgi:cyclohexa-1,5-dienecarbonyl-CoA hydratase